MKTLAKAFTPRTPAVMKKAQPSSRSDEKSRSETEIAKTPAKQPVVAKKKETSSDETDDCKHHPSFLCTKQFVTLYLTLYGNGKYEERITQK